MFYSLACVRGTPVNVSIPLPAMLVWNFKFLTFKYVYKNVDQKVYRHLRSCVDNVCVNKVCVDKICVG